MFKQKSIRTKLFSTVKNSIDGKNNFVVFKWILSFLSYLYMGAIFGRNFLYDKKIFRIKKASVPVISIGNIVAGGVGKTPFVLFLAETLMKEGKKVGILSRGYRSKIEKSGKSILGCAGNGPLFSEKIIGDEPYLIAKKIPQVLLGVGKDRYSSSQMVVEKGCDLILLDDGMQHRKLHRDIEIVVLSAKDLFGKGKFLPSGYLRDFPKRIEKADLIVLNNLFDKNLLTEIKKKVRGYTKNPIIVINPSLSVILNLLDDKELQLKDIPIGVFCGIGDPEPFCRLLKDQGAYIVSTCFFEDHGQFCLKRLQTFAEKSKKAEAKYLICTEKDQVKLEKDLNLCLPVGYVKISLIVEEGKKDLDQLIKQITL